jgi:uncharacterized damage-inducible protein DinB
MTNQERSREAILDRYGDGPAQLESAISGLEEPELDLARSTGSWSIRQIVHHVADGDDIWKIAIKAALGNSGATWSLLWYWDKPQDEWAEGWAYAGRGIESSLALFRANRRHTVQLLAQIPDAWERCIFLQQPDGEERSQETVGDMVEGQADHVYGHIDDIRRIRELHGV